MMRILLIIPTIASYNSFLKELSQAMLDKGMDVHCACSPDALWFGDIQKLDGVQIHSIPFPRGSNPIAHYRSSQQLNELVLQLKPDLIHAHFSSAIFSTALAHRAFWPITIGTFQGISFPLVSGIKGQLLKRAEILSAKRLDTVWVLSDDDLAIMQANAPTSKIYRQAAYGFGCDLGKFNQETVTRAMQEALLTQLDLRDENHIFSYIGRFVDFKGFGETIRAFLALSQYNTNVRLLLIGAKDNLHPTGLTRQEEEALEASPQILQLGWQTDVWKYLAITNTLVFPSSREGMPVSIMEALAMGVPTITRDSRGCRDVVRDNIDGFVLKDFSTESLVAAMQRLINDPLLHRKLAINALSGRERFSRQNYIDEQIMIYQKFCSQQHRSIGKC